MYKYRRIFLLEIRRDLVLHNCKRIAQCIGEGGHGGVLRIDFSSDGNWIRAEARTKTEDPATSPVVIIVMAASSGEICEDKTVSVRTKRAVAT